MSSFKDTRAGKVEAAVLGDPNWQQCRESKTYGAFNSAQSSELRLACKSYYLGFRPSSVVGAQWLRNIFSPNNAKRALALVARPRVHHASLLDPFFSGLLSLFSLPCPAIWFQTWCYWKHVISVCSNSEYGMSNSVYPENYQVQNLKLWFCMNSWWVSLFQRCSLCSKSLPSLALHVVSYELCGMCRLVGPIGLWQVGASLIWQWGRALSTPSFVWSLPESVDVGASPGGFKL